MNHFYYTTCIAYFCVPFVLVDAFYKKIGNGFKVNNYWLVVLFGNYNSVHHIILSLLSIQRFILYFWQGIGNLIDLKKKSMGWLLFLLYFGFTAKNIVFFMIINSEFVLTLDLSRTMIYERLIIYSILCISSLLYIPVVIDLRRNAHLSSVVKNRPHQYILYQTFLTITTKMVESTKKQLDKNLHFQFMISFSFFQNSDGLENDLLVLNSLVALEMISTPSLIQFSYLICNKRNLDDLRKRLSLKKIVQRIFRPNYSNQINPSRTGTNNTIVRNVL
ncbi:hypothetical protein CAEBREN_07004 [Caenorhabditis brenneri]|uniref:Uncharacterized protein n=1 Tax=Caenorhabditis brenneri TaxID=135651 RepID=G0NTM0_CAEBE|nr:hypothetical protein CAEBREN_07004 [Caenorhabditis brenneri]